MKIILAAMPVAGHLNPVLAVAKILKAKGHDIVVMSSSTSRSLVEACGVRFQALPADVDYWNSSLDDVFPQRSTVATGLAKTRFDLEHVVIDAIPAQFEALQRLLWEFPAEAIVVDFAFLGAWPFLLGATATRPLIVSLGVTVLMLERDDGAPSGPGLPPATDAATVAEYKAIAADVDTVLWKPVREHADAVLAKLGASALPLPFADAMATLSDIYLQPSTRGFEYPRRALTDNVHFVGPLPIRSDLAMPPAVKEALDMNDRQIVLVTQGTLANGDLGQLLAPTLAALADRPELLVLATTGGRPIDEVPGDIPANAIVVPMLPFDRIMPMVDVLITNGGFGTVTHALSVGVPLVVAGVSEDKLEVGARVAWSGAGIDLRTDRPTPEQVRRAVDNVLAEPGYRRSAHRFAVEAAATSAEASIAAILEDAVARRPGHRASGR